MSAQDKSTGKDRPRYILPKTEIRQNLDKNDAIAKANTSRGTIKNDEAHAVDLESSSRSHSEANLLLQGWRAERSDSERQQLQDSEINRDGKAKQGLADIHTKELAIFKQREGKEALNHDVDTTLNLSSWFGPADTDTSLQLCSWSGLAQLPGGSKAKDDTERERKFASTSLTHENLRVPSSDNLRKRPAHFISIGAAYKWDLEAAIRRENMRRDLKLPMIGHANFRHRTPAAGPAVQAPKTPEAEDVVHNAADGRFLRNREEQGVENRNLDHQVDMALRHELHIRPLTPAERVWVDRVRKDVRMQLGEGYRLTIAHVRQHVFHPVPVAPRIIPDGDEKSDVTTEALIQSSTTPSAEYEETESEFRPEEAN